MFKNLNAKIKVKFFSQYGQKCDQQGVNTITVLTVVQCDYMDKWIY